MMQGQPRSRENDELRALAGGQLLTFGWREGMPVEEAKTYVEEALGYARQWGLRQIDPTGKSLRIIRNESQAPKSKIFLFSLYPNQRHIHSRLVPPEGRSRVVTNAGRDAVDARASGAHGAGNAGRFPV
jgi:hypothetical protein